MGRFLLSCCVLCAVLLPNVGTAQVISRPAEPPVITAAAADWQIAGEPIFYAGTFYYPTGPSIFFNGNVMVRTGIYEGVPLYADATLEPWSLVYVPIGGNVMRPYERLRAGDLAGTTGSRTPSFPVQQPTASTVPTGIAGIVLPESPRPVATGGTILTPVPSPVQAPVANASRVTVQTIPAPAGNEGLWINFDGARWYHAGNSVSFDPNRFEPIASYRGFPAYRDKTGSDDKIYVSAVQDGPLVPYSKR